MKPGLQPDIPPRQLREVGSQLCRVLVHPFHLRDIRGPHAQRLQQAQRLRLQVAREAHEDHVLGHDVVGEVGLEAPVQVLDGAVRHVRRHLRLGFRGAQRLRQLVGSREGPEVSLKASTRPSLWKTRSLGP